MKSKMVNFAKNRMLNNKDRISSILSAKDFESADMNYRISKGFIHIEDLDSALVYIEKAIAKEENPKYYYVLGSIMKKKSSWRASCDAFEKADNLGYAKENDKFYKYYAESLTKMKWYDEAADMWVKYIKTTQSPSKKDYMYTGFLLHKSGDEEKAKKYFDKALQKQTNNKELGIGYLFDNVDMWEEANFFYLKKIEENEKNNEEINDSLYYRAGLTYVKMYRFEDAIPYIEKSLEYDKKTNRYGRLGLSYEKLGKYEEASIAYKNAVQTAEEFSPTKVYNYAYSLYKLGKYKECCEQLDALIIEPEKELFDIPYFKQGYEFELNSNYEEAKKCYQKAVYSYSELEPSLYERLGRSLYNLEQYEEAAFAYLSQKATMDNYVSPKKKLNLTTKYAEYYNNLKINDSFVLYECYSGLKVGGNPYALFKQLYENKDLIHFFSLVDLKDAPKHLKELDNVYFIERNSDLYLRLLASAKYLINNVTFWRYVAKDGQKYLNTWHGTPIKTLGKDIETETVTAPKNITRNFFQATHCINPNLYTHEKMRECYWITDVVQNKWAITGYPRQDLTLNMTDDEKTKLKKSLNIADNKKVILYAPTWRGVGNKPGESDDNKIFSSALNELSKIENTSVIYLGHTLQAGIGKKRNIITPEGVDTNEIMAIADVLITDYSSIGIDFLATDKPIVYFTYDLEEYTKERGMYFSVDDISDKVVYKTDELVKLTAELLKNPVITQKEKDAKAKFCYLDDGNATKRVLDLFLNDVDEYVVKEEKNTDKKDILIFPDYFVKNGITTSAVNLLNSIDRDKYNITLFLPNNIVENSTEQHVIDDLVNKGMSVVINYDQKFSTLEERWIQRIFYTTHEIYSDYMFDGIKTLNERNYKRLLGRTKYDVAIDFCSYSREMNYLIANSNADTKLVFLHNNMLGEQQVRFAYLKTVCGLYDAFDKFVSVSKQTSELNKENLGSQYNLPEHKFVDFDNIQDSKKILEKSELELEVEEDKELFNCDMSFLAVGRLSPEKDHEKMIRAFDKVLKDNKDKNLKLLIIGGGPLRIHLEKLIENLGVGDSVKLLGLRNNPYSYINKCDCFLSSSNHEGQPMTLFEALILKKDIIATDITGNRAVLDGRGGVLVDNSIDGLYEGISDYIKNEKAEQQSFDIDEYNKNAIENFYKLFDN